MHQLRWSFLLAGLAVLSGCSNSAAPVFSSPSGDAQGLLESGIVPQSALNAEAALQRVRFIIDPVAGTAAATALETRQVQQTDDTYLLSIANFTRPDTVRVTGVRRDPDAIFLDYRVTHPFAAPSNLAGPPNASNRADLSISARLLFLLDVPTAIGNTYFTGDTPVIANVGLLDNADGYYRPAGLLTHLGGFTATAFPFQLTVNEALDNRDGVSNGGQPTGNWATDGWQQMTMGPDRNGWTGFDVLHQGQAATRTLAINRAALEGGQTLTFDAVLLAKYNDPRGGLTSIQKRGNRLPASPADVMKFTYRYPHGAIDVSAIEFLGESGGLMANTISATTLSLRVRDWDALATETTFPDLAEDPDVSQVAVGEAGIPQVALSAPALLGVSGIVTFDPADLLDDDTAFGGDVAQDSGQAGDELFFQRVITNPLTSGQNAGVVYGLVRARDVEVSLDTTGWERPLQPDLTIVPSNLPEPVTYQRVAFTLAPDNAPPSMTVTIVTPTVGSGGSVIVRASAMSDADLDDLTLEADWDNNGTFDPVATYTTPYPAQSDHTSPITYNFSGTAPDQRTLPVRYSDGAATIPVSLQFEVVGECPVPPPGKVGTDRTGTWGGAALGVITDLGFATGIQPADFASFRNPAYGGVVLQQRDGLAGQHNLFRLNENPPFTPASVNFLTTGNLGGLLSNMAALDIEIDSTNRVLFTRGLTSWSHWPPIIKYFVAPNHGAGPDIYWFDYAGTPVATLGGTISTGGLDIMAICLGQNDDLYAIDRSHVLHRYRKSLGYAEDVAAPFPMALGGIIGTNSGADNLSTNRKVADLVQNWHNGAFYILTVAGTSSNNGRIHRIPCDGSAGTVSAPWTVIDIGSASRNCDIIIDQFNSGGAPIAEGDVQILVGGQTLFTSGPDLWIFNSDLVMTASQDFGTNDTTASKGRLAMTLTNRLFLSESYSSDFGFYSTAPSGWQ